MTVAKQTIRDAAVLLIVILAALSVQISPNPEVVPTVNAAEAETPTPETPIVWTVAEGTAPSAAVLRGPGEISELQIVGSDLETPCPPHIVVETHVERLEGNGAQRHQVEIRFVKPQSRPEDEGCPKAGRA